ncbi:MAG: galactokinase [Vicinamibacteria bacterium]
MNIDLTEGAPQGLPDVKAFLDRLGRIETLPFAGAARFFAPSHEVVVARAPGRLDLMGGIADYSGSLVLQWPLREATLAAVQLSDDRLLRVVSLGAADGDPARVFEMSFDVLAPQGNPLPYETARELLARDPAAQWAAYAVGPLLALLHERQPRAGGVRLLIASRVPEGKGVSSSAAMEVATMQALAAALRLAVPPREMALLCQRAENLVAGAPCGVMDPMTATCGRSGELLSLLCQPAEVLGQVPLPPELEIWGLDSGERHAVSGSDYTSVRVGAFMGARILADLAGLTVRPGPPGEPVAISDGPWGGYLANVSPSEWETFVGRIPETMAGTEFLARYGGTTDHATRVDPARTYAVRRPTAHPIHEHFRVSTFAELLAAPVTERSLSLLGECMYQSHASYSACGLGSEGTNRLVDIVRAAGPGNGVYGAKITGGGSGGTVAVLGRRGADVGRLARAYAERTGHSPHVFTGSSPGAASFGVLRLALRD